MSIKLHNIDNMEYMKDIPDNHFELAIVDPPYGGGILKKNKHQRHDSKGTSYKNKSIPPAEYYKELERVSKSSIIWGCQYMMKHLSPAGSFIIWDKGADPDLHNMSACDVAWYSKRKQIKKVSLHWCGAVKCEKEATIHIHQKPVKLYEWLLRNYAKQGDKILDTHLGSGSIAIACHNLGFDLVGCELDKKYFEAAKKRLETHQMQQRLF